MAQVRQDNGRPSNKISSLGSLTNVFHHLEKTALSKGVGQASNNTQEGGSVQFWKEKCAQLTQEVHQLKNELHQTKSSPSSSNVDPEEILRLQIDEQAHEARVFQGMYESLRAALLKICDFPSEDDPVNNLDSSRVGELNLDDSPTSFVEEPVASLSTLIITDEEIVGELESQKSQIKEYADTLSSYMVSLKHQDELLRKSSRLLTAERKNVSELKFHLSTIHKKLEFEESKNKALQERIQELESENVRRETNGKENNTRSTLPTEKMIAMVQEKIKQKEFPQKEGASLLRLFKSLSKKEVEAANTKMVTITTTTPTNYTITVTQQTPPSSPARGGGHKDRDSSSPLTRNGAIVVNSSHLATSSPPNTPSSQRKSLTPLDESSSNNSTRHDAVGFSTPPSTPPRRVLASTPSATPSKKTTAMLDPSAWLIPNFGLKENPGIIVYITNPVVPEESHNVVSVKVVCKAEISSYNKAGHEVRRNYADFVWLYNALLVESPGRVIPPISELKTSDIEAEEFLAHVVTHLQRFMNRLCKHHVLRHSHVLQTFLTSDETTFAELKLKPLRQDPEVPCDMDSSEVDSVSQSARDYLVKLEGALRQFGKRIGAHSQHGGSVEEGPLIGESDSDEAVFALLDQIEPGPTFVRSSCHALALLFNSIRRTKDQDRSNYYYLQNFVFDLVDYVTSAISLFERMSATNAQMNYLRNWLLSSHGAESEEAMCATRDLLDTLGDRMEEISVNIWGELHLFDMIKEQELSEILKEYASVMIERHEQLVSKWTAITPALEYTPSLVLYEGIYSSVI